MLSVWDSLETFCKVSITLRKKIKTQRPYFSKNVPISPIFQKSTPQGKSAENVPFSPCLLLLSVKCGWCTHHIASIFFSVKLLIYISNIFQYHRKKINSFECATRNVFVSIKLAVLSPPSRICPIITVFTTPVLLQ